MNTTKLLDLLVPNFKGWNVKLYPITNIGTKVSPGPTNPACSCVHGEGLGAPSFVSQREIKIEGRRFLIQVIDMDK